MSLMLINPRKRRGTKKRRSAAQRAATSRMLAARHGRRASNPSPRRRRTSHARRRHNPIGLGRVHHTTRRHRRHNPTGLRMGNIGDLVMKGAIGAVGGVAVNAITNFLPATFKSGNVLYVTRAGLAILVGTVGRKFLGANARVAAEGALAINFADLLNTFAAGKLPGSQLHGVGGEYMGEFLSGQHMVQQLPYAHETAVPGMGDVGGMGEFLSEAERMY